MEVRALCIKLFMTLVVLCAHGQKVDAVSFRISPNRLQFFEYESVTFYCDGVLYCQVVHKFKGKIESCNKTNMKTPTGSYCTISNIYPDDGGEYWCETEGGKRSNKINITVTVGSVILESPAIPVIEEGNVTLSCRNKMASSNFKTDFYKYGHLIHNSSTGNVTIHRVSKSDEGLYKCGISGVGESSESWLSVRAFNNSATNPDIYKDTRLFTCDATPWIISTTVFGALLLLVGLYHFGKCCWERGKKKPPIAAT
ncbi:Fc receptor-like protein 5 [Astatotilapia calliptera]|uniref:Fc receptor-like protein 5 n=1 Tax=Astatotilapia calliptera TaxID=8154 RepID=UPI000E402F68|nr:Fc receptor-like protein 5 [Astatotilapia calliptera]